MATLRSPLTYVLSAASSASAVVADLQLALLRLLVEGLELGVVGLELLHELVQLGQVDAAQLLTTLQEACQRLDHL